MVVAELALQRGEYREATRAYRLAAERSADESLAEQAAREGVWDLRRAGLEKVKQGVTSLDEINRVTID